jgi:phenylacetate-coenzyme A ligase PaaK-like adenylate-forming protein
MSDFHLEVYKLVKALEENQYKDRNISKLIPECDILTREKLQSIKVDKNRPFVSTSGSTGQPVFVQKYYQQNLWYSVTNIRELLWLGWDVTKTIAIINAPVSKIEKLPWITNPYLFGPKNGTAITHPVKGNLQKWLNEESPQYLHSYPSIISTLDTSNLEGIKSTGERGATNYSSEELGTIALTCPNNPDVYHVMENIVIEIDDDKNIIATDLTHPYIKRYKIGDKGEFANCNCGRTLQTLKKDVVGRVRNMVKYPDGTSAWPIFGTVKIRNLVPTVAQVQAIQESITNVTLKIQGDVPIEKHQEIKNLVMESLKYNFEIKIELVDAFPNGKFEEFVCKI